MEPMHGTAFRCCCWCYWCIIWRLGAN